jgi:glycosyltransferase involved in cell wall biosynthesis
MVPYSVRHRVRNVNMRENIGLRIRRYVLYILAAWGSELMRVGTADATRSTTSSSPASQARPRASFRLGCRSRPLLPHPDALHLEHVSRVSDSAGLVTRWMTPLAHYLRTLDVSSAARADSFVANSATMAKRIRRFYGVESAVIHPPVDTVSFSIAPPSELGDHYLMAGELVSYKRPDLAIRAFNEMQLKLVVIGGGEMLDEVRSPRGSDRHGDSRWQTFWKFTIPTALPALFSGIKIALTLATPHCQRMSSRGMMAIIRTSRDDRPR